MYPDGKRHAIPVLPPGQLHFWQFSSIPKGFVILFKVTEFDAVKENNLLDLFKKLIGTKRLKLRTDEYPDYLLKEIHNQFKFDLKYSKEIIHGLLKALLGRLLQTSECNQHKSEMPETIYDKFKQLLVKECPRLHKVNEFANLLNITPQNLNSICKKKSGENAREIIAHQILL